MGVLSLKSLITEMVLKDFQAKYDKLLAFYQAVAKMTVGHCVINDTAVVPADRLGAELEKVDPEWYKQAG